ncbi:hypothetical protein E1264_17800 [Actinomadura sp. KC216]|uniref:hypothetical protein n=1 Tax=Actinomadura sp. KC216 TaxID=2530370 RepID=UPI001047F3BE|nr:hypothetical protein [Actinomadura sp. KC216]TDB86453.1 hypothetical protein E1264_17800 [Actinomadura sp. KC216]
MTLTQRIATWGARRIAGMFAGRALTATIYGDCHRGHQITADVIERSGRLGARALAAVWCEAMLADVPRSARRRGNFRPLLMTPWGQLAPEDAPTSAMWMARLVAAHASRDWDMCRALVDAVPDDQIEEHLALLLHTAAAATIARPQGVL